MSYCAIPTCPSWDNSPMPPQMKGASIKYTARRGGRWQLKPDGYKIAFRNFVKRELAIEMAVKRGYEIVFVYNKEGELELVVTNHNGKVKYNKQDGRH